jgi:hypothetical protein
VGFILGLDVSTSCVGTCVLDDESGKTLLLEHVEFKGCRSLWDKADRVLAYLEALRGDMARDNPPAHIARVAIEEALMGFRPGMSSAQTISTLMRFNGIVSYIARQVFGLDPEYLGSAHARKLCGVKLVRTGVGGPQKSQVFAHMQAHDLSDVAWPLKKNGKVVDWAMDATDAYVVARAAQLSPLA